MTRKPAARRSTPSRAPALDERATALHLLSSEFGHDLAHTQNFLRYLTDVLAGELAPATAKTELLEFANRELIRTERSLRQLRRFRLPTPSLEDVELSTLLAQCISQLQSDSLHDTIEISMDIPRSCSVHSESIFLEAAMRHLLLNGAANCASQGRITISASLIDLDTDRRLRVDIVDTGAELNPSALFSVWEMMPLDSPQYHRAIAFRLLRCIDGTLDYQRTEAGNRFRITLPAPIGTSE